MSIEKCFVCQNTSEEECLKCDSGTKFCENHQFFHQDDRSGECYPFKVEERPVVGRILLASRDINPGEVIFKEKEMVVGPCKTKYHICISCGKKVNGSVRCKCLWYLCEEQCSEMSRHSEEECNILAQTNPDDSDLKIYRGVMPLRVLNLPKHQLDYFLQFMDHGSERGEKFEEIIDLIRNRWKQEKYSGELIARVEGILDVNTVEHRVNGGDSIRGFLPITSLASHACISNSIKDKTDPGYVTTRAKTTISKGEEITFHYSGGLKGRFIRRKALRDGWFFWCNCTRCSSPGELGAESSSLLCCQPNCHQGVVRPIKPLNMDSTYSCDKCGHEESAEFIKELEDDLTAKLENCYSTATDEIEDLLVQSTTKFHHNHFLILIMKWLLVTSWGRVKGLENAKLSDQILEKKIRYCKEYLEALAILDPGISHNRGLTLWELQSAHTFLINRKFQSDRLSPVSFLAGLKEALEMVTEAIKCLQFNQEGTAEYQIQQHCIASKPNLIKTIEFFSNVIPK